MKIINPSGEKIVNIKNNEILNILLEDFDKGSRKFNLVINLESKNARCNIKGRVKVFGEDSKSWIICQNFQGEEQIGDINLRGISDDNSFLEFDGQIFLKENSRKQTANISEKIILINNGKAKILPVLTVKNDDVISASHGASIAPFSDEDFLYLASRGIDQENAKKILMTGFLSL